MQKIISLCLAISLVLVASACARNLASDTYTDGSTVGLVLEGTVVSVRPVKITGSDKMQNNSMGLLAGGVGGAVAGSNLGKGGGQAAGTVGGAIAGAALGALIEGQLSQSEGLEYIIRVKKENLSAGSNRKDSIKIESSKISVADKLKNTVETDTKTELISVVQGTDTLLNVGQQVFVIYSDDRPRLVAAN